MFAHLGRNDSSDVGTYRSFVDRGTFDKTWTYRLLPTLPPNVSTVSSSCAPHTTARSPSYLPPSTPRPRHRRRPHPPTDTVMPPRRTPFTPPTGPALPSPQKPPFHTHKHHTTSQQTHLPGTLREAGTKINSSTYQAHQGKPTAMVPRKSVRRSKQDYHSHFPVLLSPSTTPSSFTSS